VVAILRFFCTLLILAPALSAVASDFPAAQELLAEYCHRCHNGQKHKGDLDLERFDSEAKVFAHYRVWTKVLEQIADGEMPPEDKDQPSPEERQELVDYINRALERAASANAGDPGHVVMRRLTNAEYDHAIRDLTGVDLRTSQYFPGDAGGGEGFSNTGAVLFVSPVHLQKYLGAARSIAEHASVLPGTGIAFSAGKVGNRSGKMLVGAVEKTFRDWYRMMAAPLIPKDLKSQRIGDYLTACWTYRHRQHFGNKELDALAKEAGLNADFLTNWWSYLNSTTPKSRYLDLDRLPFRALPGPDPKRPGVIPDSVAKGIEQIRKNREGWYRSQRRQQDANAETAKTVKVATRGLDVVQLIVTDAGDGHTGDRIQWWDVTIKLKDGKTVSARQCQEWHINEANKALPGFVGKPADTRIDGRSKAEWEHRRRQSQAFLDRAEKFSVRAPSVVALPVPWNAVEVSARQQLEWKRPDADSASYQALLWAGPAPNPLPPNIPGHLIHWLRGSSASKRFWPHYGPMRTIFPDTHDRRLIEVELNVKRDFHQGVYYLSDAQLARYLSEPQQRQLQALREDWEAITEKKLDEARSAWWDDRVVAELQRLAAQAWRRPLSDEEGGYLRRQYSDYCSQGETREAAARLVLTRILVSPHFLYRIEKRAPDDKEHPVSSPELATRLSFLLWASIPDQALIDAATSGKLSEKADIDAQVARMLRDPRTVGMATEFFGQWLRFHAFGSHKGVDPKAFPKFTDTLRLSMYKEAVHFCSHIIREDRPVLELVTADYSFLNEPLGWHYGVPELHGDRLVKTKVSNYHRGGLLGMGAILTSTAYPLRTSPVLRGNWLLEAVLGTPVPPPPQDVPPLGNEPMANGLTVRQRLAKHRENPQCAGCHDRIDPLGFALENFDPIGRWRDNDPAGKPIDDKASLKGGVNFQGVAGLRDYLHSQQDQLLKHMCTKLVGYALGREVVITDQALIQQMVDNLKANEFRFSAAIRPLVHSRQFRNRL
jgi:hypothetical protein